MGMKVSDSSNEVDRSLITYYSELGTVSKGTLHDEPDGFYVYSLPPQDLLYDSFDDIQRQIHSRLTDLDNLIIERLFGSKSAYYSIIQFCPIAISEGGFSPEMPFDRNSFADYVKRFSFEEARRFIYLDDLRYLTESFGETYNQAVSSLRMVFRELGEIEPIGDISNGLFKVSSPKSHSMMREVESFIIRLYSSLDILSRLLFELDRIPDRFESFKKIRSDKSALYSAFRSKGPHSGDEGHICNDFPEALYLEDLRNEIVHNRAFENSATCYISLENGIVKERFFFLPDSDENGRLTRWNGRCRFYSQENKGTERLSSLYREISIRISNSLDYAIDDLSKEIMKMRASGELREMDPDAIKEAIRSFRAAAMPATSKIKGTATLDPSEEVHLDTF